MFANYAKKRYALTSGTWTPVVSPIPCNTFWMRELTGVDMLERTDAGDVSTEDPIPAGFMVDLPSWRGGTVRFPEGTTITNVSVPTGSGTCIVTFVY